MSRFGTVAACVLCVAFASTWSALAGAADAAEPDASSTPARYPQIRLDVSPPNSPVVPLLRAELGELGLTVVDNPRSDRSSITVHATLSEDALEVRISDDATGSTLVRETFSVGDGRTMDPRTAVLHASELLRWHLRYQPAPPERVPPPPPPKPVPAPPEAARSDLRLSVLPTALYSPGATSLGLGAELDLLQRWDWWGVRVLGASALVPNRLTVPEGQLQISSAWAGLEGTLVLEPQGSATSLEVGFGAALFSSTLHGTAGDQNVGRDDRVLTAAPMVDVRVRERVTRGLTLVLASAFLAPLEASRLRVLDRQVGTYGREVLTFGLGLELTLF